MLKLFKKLANVLLKKKYVIVSLTQLVGTMHNIWGSNFDHHQKFKKSTKIKIIIIKNYYLYLLDRPLS